VFSLQLVLDALTFEEWPDHAEEYRRQVFNVTSGVLRWLNEAARAAHLFRYEHVGAAGRIEVPATARLRSVVSALTLSTERFAEMFDGPVASAASLVRDLGDGPVPFSDDPSDQPFELRPILKRGDRYLLAEPAAAVVALRHFAIVTAAKAGLRDELATRIANRTRGWLIEAVRRLGWAHQLTLPQPVGDRVVSLIFGIDTDKVAHVALVNDDLDGYDHENPRGWWDANAEVTQRMVEVEGALMYGPPPRPNDVLHLVVLGGIGRSSMFGLPASDAVIGPQKLLTTEALEAITQLRPDRLSLYRAARAGDRLREHARVMSMNALDEYALWLDHDESFNLSDEGLPDFLVIQGDWGRSLRERAASELDAHAAPTPEGTTVPVIRIHPGADIPIYGDFVDTGSRIRFVVRGQAGTTWICPATEPDPDARLSYVAITDCLAYWIWQLDADLAPLARPHDPLAVDVAVRLPDGDGGEPSEKERSEDQVAFAATTATGISVEVFENFSAVANQPDNVAERRLVATVINALAELSQSCGGPGVTEAAHAEILDRVAPLGPKRKINVFEPDLGGLIDPSELPRYRPIPKAPTEEVLDGLGSEVADRLGLEVGVVAPERQNDVLKSAVEILFERFARLVSTISPEGVLEYLVAQNEAIVHHNTELRMTVGARLACFDATALIDDLRDEMLLASQGAVAVRFVIEYITANPPRGLRPWSVGLFDDVVALAGQIVTRGMQSDAVKYELDADAEISTLGSGRLGYDRTRTYYSGRQAYLNAAIPAMLRGMAAGYDRPWRAKAEPPADVDALDAAVETELGFTLTDLVALFTYTAESAAERGPVAVEQLGALVAELAHKTGWSEHRVRSGLDHLTLRSRPAFLKPPRPFSTSDIYPWRFNRALSYIRRPLLWRGDGDELIWGARHTAAAGHYLVELILSERYKAVTPELKAIISKMRQAETRRFNQLVADAHRNLGHVVRTNLTKADGKRIARANNQTLGDLDVVAADLRARILYVDECKDLEGARTPAELHNEIASTFGSGRTLKSAADKHLERVAWVKSNTDAVLTELGVEEGGLWEVRGRIVTDIEVLSPYVMKCTLSVVTLHTVAGQK